MITAVDTNILMDVLRGNEHYRAQSIEWLQNARTQGPILLCEVVYAELVGSFPNRAEFDDWLQTRSLTFSPINTEIAYQAGLRWAQYRQAGGPRTRLLPDFLIGSHAHVLADRFVTRDQGFYSTYFPELK